MEHRPRRRRNQLIEAKQYRQLWAILPLNLAHGKILDFARRTTSPIMGYSTFKSRAWQDPRLRTAHNIANYGLLYL
jgi:hypothetical protein